MRVLTLVVLACLAVAGCSVGAQTTGLRSTSAAQAPGNGSAASQPQGSPVPTESDDSPAGTEFANRVDIVGSRTTVFESWSEVDEYTVAVHFVTGTPECYGAYSTVVENDSTVAITLHTGSLPEAVDKMCVLVAVLGTLDVPLSAPLGDRRVVNG